MNDKNSLPIQPCCENLTNECLVSRRDFIKTTSIGTGIALTAPVASAQVAVKPTSKQNQFLNRFDNSEWPILKRYPQTHVAKIALPLGGVGAGTVSLGGRGDLRDWEIMNRPAKGFTPKRGDIAPFFALFTRDAKGNTQTRVLEGPVEAALYEGSHGSPIPNDNVPRFSECAFATAYPFGQCALSDPSMPLDVNIMAFNPFIPCDTDASSIPAAVLRFRLTNNTQTPVFASVCGSIPNFIGMDGREQRRDWKGDFQPIGAKNNKNKFRKAESIQGVLMTSEGVDPKSERWGSIALSTHASENSTHRTDWPNKGWGAALLDFWDDFSVDGKLEARDPSGHDMPIASLTAEIEVPARSSQTVEFYLAWHFPNRSTWSPQGNEDDRIGNYYTTQFDDAWAAARHLAENLKPLEERTITFVKSFCESNLPEVVKESALFNLSTVRTQTCFRTPDGRFYGFEGCCNTQGCCHGSCTHVWNYEQAVAHLFGDLAMTMREVEFAQATNAQGMMNFRVHLPLERAHDFGKAAADGQMGCIMKVYRDWQLSGDNEMLKALWPHVKKALEFCWITGGWDADRDGVMEGCQHNTMDVEYYGPNPQMGIWYLGALRASEEMAKALGNHQFAAECRRLFKNGSAWLDANLFNGDYYIHKIQAPKSREEIAPSLLIGMGAKDVAKPDYQLGEGCLVDQLVGQYMAHICGLGYLVNKDNVTKTLASIMKYNFREDLSDHFNCMRTYALADESALLMASYPKSRPENPFPYFTEAMTGFEYTAAIGMIYESQVDEGLKCIQAIRDRYDGQKRNPYNEAECGHHYARALASWAAVLALTGFSYSAPDKQIKFANKLGTHFWATGRAWGTCQLTKESGSRRVALKVMQGSIRFDRFTITGFGQFNKDGVRVIGPDGSFVFTVNKT